MDLFEYSLQKRGTQDAPLAARMRPTTLEEFVGQEQIVGKDKLLYRAIKGDRLGSLIFYGPPGTGKTTLAKIIANTTKSEFVNAPIINELPVTLECELVDVIGGSKYLGRIKNVSVDERVLGEDGEISLDLFFPITYDTVHHGYYRLGERVGNAFQDGGKLK